MLIMLAMWCQHYDLRTIEERIAMNKKGKKYYILLNTRTQIPHFSPGFGHAIVFPVVIIDTIEKKFEMLYFIQV